MANLNGPVASHLYKYLDRELTKSLWEQMPKVLYGVEDYLEEELANEQLDVELYENLIAVEGGFEWCMVWASQ